MTSRNIVEYDEYKQEELRSECVQRGIVINSKDGVKTLASKLKVNDRASQNMEEEMTNLVPGDGLQSNVDSERFEKWKVDVDVLGSAERITGVSQWEEKLGLTFQQRMELMQL